MAKRQGTDKLPFKDILGSLMAERGLTVSQVASLAGVSRSVAQSWLAGANPHDLRAVNRLAKSLGVSMSTLLLGESDERLSLSASELFERIPLFDGFCEVKINRLIKRNLKEI